MRYQPRERAGLRAWRQRAATAVVACVVAAGCGGAADPLDLPEAKSSSTSSSVGEQATSTPTRPTATGSTLPIEPSETGSTLPTEPTRTDSADPDDPLDSQGADDNVSIGPVFAPSPIDFGAVAVGASKTLRIGLENDTDWQFGIPGFAFTIVSLPLTGDGFSLTENPCIGRRLEVGDACQIAIAFHPDARGEFTSDLGLTTSPPVRSNHAARFRGTGGPLSGSPSKSPVGPSPSGPTVKGNDGAASPAPSSPTSPPVATPSETPVGPSPSSATPTLTH